MKSPGNKHHIIRKELCSNASRPYYGEHIGNRHANKHAHTAHAH